MSLLMDWCWFQSHSIFRTDNSESHQVNCTNFINFVSTQLPIPLVDIETSKITAHRNKQHVTGDKICDYLCNVSQDRATFVRYIHLEISLKRISLFLLSQHNAATQCTMAEIVLPNHLLRSVFVYIPSQLSYQYFLIMNNITFSPYVEHNFQWKTLGTHCVGNKHFAQNSLVSAW